MGAACSLDQIKDRATNGFAQAKYEVSNLDKCSVDRIKECSNIQITLPADAPLAKFSTSNQLDGEGNCRGGLKMGTKGGPSRTWASMGEEDDEGNMSGRSRNGTRRLTNPLSKGLKEWNGPLDRDEDDFEKKKVQESLYEACRAGDFRKVVQAITEGSDIHAPNNRGCSPLMLASVSYSKGNMDCVKFLVEALSELEAKDDNGWTPLLHACRNSQTSICEFLLESKASVKTRSKDGRTCVMMACMDGAESLCFSLVNKKVGVDKKDDLGWTLLFYATHENRSELVKWLLKKTANVKDKAKDGTTALMLSANNGNKLIANSLIKKLCNVNQKNAMGGTALMMAIRAHKEEFFEYMLDQPGIDLGIKNVENEDASEVANQEGYHAFKMKIDTKARLLEDASPD